MHRPIARRTRLRFAAAASAAFVGLAGLVVTAPSAEATWTPRTFTAVMAPVTATHGASAAYAVTVTNTSTKISALDRFLLSVPEGFTVDSSTLGTTNAGWTVALQSGGSTIKATTNKPIRYGVRKGQTLGISFAAVAPLGCAAANVTWPVYADGVFLPFTLEGALPTSTIAEVPPPCASVVGQPGVKIPVADLTIAGGQADLENGANGPVSLIVQACSTDEPFCSNGSELELLANFKDPLGQPLYGFEDPAVISRVCEVDLEDLSNTGPNCRHQKPGLTGTEGEAGQTDYTYNYACAYGCAGYGLPYGEREVEEDFAWHPTYVSINNAEFALADRCVPVGDLSTKGKMLTAEAQLAGFCVDVNAITRAGNSFTGDLTIPVLFVEDIKLRP